jgi:hypothetical protein
MDGQSHVAMATGHDFGLGCVEFGHRVGNGEIEDGSRVVEALGMLRRLEDSAAIGALALEHAGSIVQAMGEYVDLGVLPRHDLPIEPDETFALIER